MALREEIVAAVEGVRVEPFPLPVVEAAAAPTSPAALAEEAAIAGAEEAVEEVISLGVVEAAAEGAVIGVATVAAPFEEVVAAVDAVVAETMARLSTR